MKKQKIVWQIMRHILILLVVVLIAAKISALVACGKIRIQDGSIVVLPPTRVGTMGIMKANLETEYTFESAFSEADMVAHIRIGNWKSEDSNIEATYYKATILHQYKGEPQKEIVLKQSGYSKYTAYPLFTYGNELLVFCNKSETAKDRYWIIGSFTTVLDAATAASGELYFLDRYGILGERTEKLTNYISQPGLRSELKENVVKKDPFLVDCRYSYIFAAKDIEALIENGDLY